MKSRLDQASRRGALDTGITGRRTEQGHGADAQERARLMPGVDVISDVKGSLAMVADLLETLANRPGFSVQVHPGKHEAFEVSAADTRGLMSLLLRRQRERSGLSLAEAAARLGAKSRNAYARYERGTSVPTLDKLTELLQAVAPGQDFVLQQSMVG